MNIEIYSNKDCVQCEQTKRWLISKGIPFDSFMIADSPEIQELIAIKGYASAPIVLAGDLSWSGFRIDKLKTIEAYFVSENKGKMEGKENGFI